MSAAARLDRAFVSIHHNPADSNQPVRIVQRTAGHPVVVEDRP
jgi:hypothetical protein